MLPKPLQALAIVDDSCCEDSRLNLPPRDGGGRGLNDNRCEHMLFMSRGETFKKEEPPPLGIKYVHGGR